MESTEELGQEPLDFTFPYKVYGRRFAARRDQRDLQIQCAYCETFYGATQPVAVEHFRPKGEVIEGKVRVKPGLLLARGDGRQSAAELHRLQFATPPARTRWHRARPRQGQLLPARQGHEAREETGR
jgi:hypothetical protein